jgi:predicted SAM-dependent methyltransferase
LALPHDTLRLLNFGCGLAVHPDWVNIDSSPVLPGVIRHDLRRGLPFPGDSFDAVYGSHVLEHLEPEAGAKLLRECRRVLKPQGIVRIVVPDLEAIARLYLESLAQASAGENHAAFRYDWAMLELYDQSVRTVSGGRMASCLDRKLEEREARFVEGRIGAEAMEHGDSPVRRRPLALRRIRSAARALRAHAASACAWLFLGREGAAGLREGLFRRSGEVHQHMYDRFSLKRAMELSGFAEVRSCSAGESGIPDFARYGLEVRNGQARKPDSLYLEGRKARAA